MTGPPCHSSSHRLRLWARCGVFLFLLACGQDGGSPSSPAPKANLVLDGLVTEITKFSNTRCYQGKVKNTGNATAWAAKVTFTIYDQNNVIIDTAAGFPANLDDIPPAVSAAFEACAFNAEPAKIVRYEVKLDWLQR